MQDFFHVRHRKKRPSLALRALGQYRLCRIAVLTDLISESLCRQHLLDLHLSPYNISEHYKYLYGIYGPSY